MCPKINISTQDAKLIICGDGAGGHLSALLSNDYCKLLDDQVLIYPCLEFSSDYDDIYKKFSKPCYLLDCTNMNNMAQVSFIALLL